MFRKDKPLKVERNLNMVLTHAALGDMIASLPAVRYARKVRPADARVNLWLPEHAIPLVRHLLAAEIEEGKSVYVLPLHAFAEASKAAGNDNVAGVGVVNFTYRNTITRNKTDLVKFGYLSMIDRDMDDPHELSYLTAAPLGPKKIDGGYIVIPANGTTVNKTPPAGWLGAMIEWCLTNGYRPVITGKKDTIVKVIGDDKPVPIVSHYAAVRPDLAALAIDLRDKLDLLECRDVLGHARAVIGYDGGTIHLAATTDVPIVYCLTTTTPDHRPVHRHGVRNWRLTHVTPRDLECAGCQSNWDLMFGYNFRDCAYGDNLCVQRIAPEDCIDGLRFLGL